MAHTWTKIGELEEFSAGGLIKADDFNEIHEEIRDSVNDFVDEVDEVVEDLEAADTALGGRLTTAEGTITSHGTRLTTAEGTLTTHGSTLTSHGSTLTNHGSRLTTAESDIDTLETSVESTQEDVEDLEDAVDTVEARVDAVEDDIETLETLVAANTTAITNEATRAGGVEAGLNTRLGTAESTITSHTSTLTGHTNTLGQHTNSINNHNNRLSVAEGNISTLNTNKQNKLTAGENITISNNVISAIDTNSVFEMDSDTPIADIQAAQAEGKIIMLVSSGGSTYLLTFESTQYYYFTTFHSGGSVGVRVYTAQLKKSDHTWTSSSFMLQNQLTAGTGITISNNVISATGGSGVTLLNEDGTYTDVLMALAAGSFVIYENSDTHYRWMCQGATMGSGSEIIFARADIYDEEPVMSYGFLEEDGTLADLVELNYTTLTQRIHWCTYGSTTITEIQNAINNGKWPVIKYEDGIFPFTYKTSTYYYFSAIYTDVSRWIKVKISDGTYNLTSRGLESTSNKKASIEGNETSVTYYPTTSAVYDYAEPKHQDFRLLNEITLNGEASITLTADADGVAYDFKEMVVLYNNVTPSDTTVQCNLKGYAYDQFDHVIGGMYFDTWKTNRYGRSYIKYEGGFYRTINQKTASGGQWNAALTSESSTMWSVFNTTSRIRKINIASNTSGITMASGTVQIYGR